MLVTDTPDLYERCFALHDQGHLPLRRGTEIGKRPFLGLNLRMNELSAAVFNVQLGKLDRILSTLRGNRTLFQNADRDDSRRLVPATRRSRSATSPPIWS